jgi:hypothetical protein
MSGADPSPLVRWVGRWQATLDATTTMGRIDTTCWGSGRVVLGPPTNAEEIAAVEATIGLPIPSGLRQLFSMARSVEAVWHFNDDVNPPEPFDQIFAGDCSWDLDSVVEVHEGYRGWVKDVFPDPKSPYDSVWHDKFPFLEAPNGDIVAIDGHGRVVYLSHDDGQGHGYLLGRDVVDFLDRWTAIGYPGSRGLAVVAVCEHSHITS